MELLKMKAESQQLKEGDEKKLAEKSQELEESEARSASLTKTNAKLIEALSKSLSRFGSARRLIFVFHRGRSHAQRRPSETLRGSHGAR